eukprot:5208702-Amphidinium_carterae.1
MTSKRSNSEPLLPEAPNGVRQSLHGDTFSGRRQRTRSWPTTNTTVQQQFTSIIDVLGAQRYESEQC